MANKSDFCFLVLLFCFALHVQARESMFFFSKFTHFTTNKNVGPSPKPEVSPEKGPSPAPAPAPVPVFLEARTGDGHFGPGSGLIPQTKESWPTTTTTNDEIDQLVQELDRENHDTTEKPDGENYDVNQFAEDFDSENHDDEGRHKSKYYTSNEYYNNNNNNGNKYHERSNYDDNVNGYEQEERQGLSDTRFLENGRYFYDVKGENYKNDPDRYAREGRNVRGEGYNYGNVQKHPSEFGSMEEYSRSREGRYQRGREEFVP